MWIARDIETTFGDIETTFGDIETTFGDIETTFGDIETTFLLRLPCKHWAYAAANSNNPYKYNNRGAACCCHLSKPMRSTSNANLNPSLPEDEQTTEVIRVEANLEEMPVFSATKRSRKEEIVTWRRKGRDPKTGLPIEQSMVIRPARGLGLPGQVERDLYYLVISPWVEANGFGRGGTIGPITYTEALVRLGWQRSGQNYGKIREALRTLVSLTFEFNNCIISGDSREIESYVYGHLFENVAGVEERAPGAERVKRGEFVILAADWFVRSHQASYVKPLDLTVYRSLKTPVAQSLYTFLDKRAYSSRRRGYEREVVEDVFDLRERFRLGVRQTKHLLERLRLAHEDLLKNWPLLQGAEIRKTAPGRYCCVYTFDLQYELPLADKAAKKAPEALPAVAQSLADRGMTPEIARKIAAAHPEDLILRQIDIHDQELASGTKHTNPGGRLRKRIEQDWAPFKGYRTPEERSKVVAAAAKDRRQRDEAEDRRVNWWKYQAPEEKAQDYVRGPWAVKWQAEHGFKGEPSESERRAALEDALRLFGREAELARQGSQEAPGSALSAKDGSEAKTA